MSHEQPPAKQYPPAPTREEYPDQEEFEERLSRWRWTVGRNMAFADLRAKTAQENQPAALPEPKTKLEPLSPEFERLVDRLMLDPKNKNLTREQIQQMVAAELEASGG